MNQDKLVTIPIGPEHPALDEPGCFTVTLDGEKVVNIVVGVGYNHRGLEKACESRTYIQDLYIIERVCGICSHTHSTAYCQGLEELAGVEITRRAKYIRVLVAELERLHSHLLWLGVAGHEIGFDTLFMYAWRDRERVLDVLAEVGGNRVNYGVNTIGGVRRDVDPELETQIRSMADALEKEFAYFLELAMTDSVLAARFAGIGVLPRPEAERFGVVGPVARACGIADDVRVVEPYAAYGELKVNQVTDDHCDVLGRTIVRIKELQESLRLIRACLDGLPEGALKVNVPRRLPKGEVISRTEAPRGENIHFIRSNGTDMPDRIRVRAPSEANWHGMRRMMQGAYLADVPIIVAANDPCYSCTDRAVVLKGAGPDRTMDWEQLCAYGVEWYRSRGADIALTEQKLKDSGGKRG
jgi:membrane-bound hydrogenase subunit alpha